jgi:hypothetical protein
MTREDWNRFCTDVDAQFKPINSVAAGVKWFAFLIIGSGFAFFVLAILGITDLIELFVPIFFIATMVLMIMICGVNRATYSALTSIEALCETSSHQYKTLSFHLHTPHSEYGCLEIEVSVDINHTNNNRMMPHSGVGYLPPPV